MKPLHKPLRPFFSSGPCAKPPGWDLQVLKRACVGRSHRSKLGQERLAELIQRTKKILGIPSGYEVGIVPGSATGAMELALWSLLGIRGVDVWSWDVFGALWGQDVCDHLKLSGGKHHQAPFGQLPDFQNVRWDCDQVFTWCGTTAGVWTQGEWLSSQREGLTFCDATSAAFAAILPWSLLDVTIFSWQKGLGGEAGHGMVVFSPRALERLQNYDPPWPLPRLFRMKQESNILSGIFQGNTINTPSLLCVEDSLFSLAWVDSIGGLAGCCQRVQNNYRMLEQWVQDVPWVDFFVSNPDIRSPMVMCLKIVDPKIQELSEDQHRAFLFHMGRLLEQEGAAFDIVNHKYAPPSLRIWCGPTVDVEDLKCLGSWLEWAFQEAQNNQKTTILT